MDAQQFLVEFGHIANAPGGVDQLRQMVYQLAITGTLTLQVSADGNARALLAEIGRLREQLVRDKKYKRLPKLEAQALSMPSGIDLPASWCWTRLLDVGEISPRNDAEDEALASFIPMSGIPQLHQGALFAEAARWREIKKGFTHFANGDVVVAKITPCFENGKAASITGLEHGIGAGTTELHVFRPIHPGVLSGYVYLFLRSPYFAIEGERSMTGTAGQKRLPTDYFATRAFPLPPTEEQSRIVAKVDELMALCDQLEAQQQQRRSLQNKLRQSTLQAVAAASSPHELQTTWVRLADNFGRLFDTQEDVAELRMLVLDLAIQGYLTEQFSGDESADALIVRSLEAKRSRLASGEMKSKKPSATDIADVEIPMPSHWGKAPLNELFQFIDYRGKTPIKTNGGVVLVTAKNVRPGLLAKNPIEYISEASYQEWMTRGFPRAGDLLITTEAPLGNVARIEESPSFALAQRVIDLQPFSDVNTQCAMYFMMSPIFQRLLEENSTGMTAKGIKAGKLKQLLLPVPPKEEQFRIVARVEQLLETCSVISKQLERSKAYATWLAAACVASITGIAITPEEDAPLKAPQTELFATLRLGQAPDIKAQAPLATILARHKGELSANDLCQRFCGMAEIDAFYAQLKVEVTHGWIQQPEVAEMREKASV